MKSTNLKLCSDIGSWWNQFKRRWLVWDAQPVLKPSHCPGWHIIYFLLYRFIELFFYGQEGDWRSCTRGRSSGDKIKRMDMAMFLSLDCRTNKLMTRSLSWDAHVPMGALDAKCFDHECILTRFTGFCCSWTSAILNIWQLSMGSIARNGRRWFLGSVWTYFSRRWLTEWKRLCGEWCVNRNDGQ